MVTAGLGMPAADWQVRVEDGCICSYCGLSGDGDFSIWMNLGIDHIVPRGGDGPDNKTLACGECNTLKGKYRPNGTTREERIADARRYVEEKRERSKALFARMMDEIKKRR